MEEHCQSFVNYKEHEGCCNITQRYKEDGQNVGLWLSQQRVAKIKE